jgi:hypothetical protein
MSIGSFSAASIDSSDDTGSIESMSNLDPIATLQEGLDEMEVFGREMNNYTYK